MTDADLVLDLLRSLNARATGLWRVEGSELVQVAFAATSDMPASAAEGFAAATRRASLDRPEFGIVRAALTRRLTITRVAEADPSIGSGYWLRAFGADRSIAWPIRVEEDRLIGVISVAMSEDGLSDLEVEGVLKALTADLNLTKTEIHEHPAPSGELA